MSYSGIKGQTTTPKQGSKLDYNHSLSRGLMGLWLFNEGSGTRLNDISGHNNHGVLSNTTPARAWVGSPEGGAIKFDGVDDYVVVTDKAILDTTSDLTIVVRFNALNWTGEGVDAISTLVKKDGNYLLRKDLNVAIGGGVFLKLYWWDGTNLDVYSIALPSTGVWHTVVATVHNNTTRKIYVDGVEVVGTDDLNNTGTRNLTNNLAFGNHQSAGTESFSGDISHIRLYNRVLTPLEISQLQANINAGVATTQPRRYFIQSGIMFDAASNSGYQAAASTYNWNHTCTGSDRYLKVGVSMLSLAQTVSSITYGGVAMTFLGARSSVSGAARVELWGLIAPTTGVNSIVVTLTGSIASASVASSYTGVHQTSPTEGFNSAQATNVGAADATVDITTVADNDWVVDVVATDDGAITVGTGQVSRNNVTGAGGSGADSDEGPKTPAGAVTMSWTNVAALATWAIAGIALRPVAAAALGSLIKTKKGLAIASVKTFKGLAIASLKTAKGLTNV